MKHMQKILSVLVLGPVLRPVRGLRRRERFPDGEPELVVPVRKPAPA